MAGDVEAERARGTNPDSHHSTGENARSHRNIIVVVVNGVQSGRRRPSIVAVELKPLTKLHGAEDIGQTTLSIDGVTRFFAIEEQRSKTGAAMQ